MQFPQDVYIWLVSTGIISNLGEQNDKGMVVLPANLINNFDNGYYVGQIIRKIFGQNDKKVMNSLVNVKADNSKNAKLTNWSFLWLAFESIQLKLDARIKQLILQGEQALIVQVIRQLFERDLNKDIDTKIHIKPKQSSKPKIGNSTAVDVKKINLQKAPQESQSSLQFLMLLLKSSLGMNLQQILGLFTNQNKYLAHIIVKGINDNFDAVILFYSLLNKYSDKLKKFYEQDNKDAEACFYALKPGFISKNEKVAQLTIELFGKFGNIYSWFISEDSKCAGTCLLGIKRHINLRQQFWTFLLNVIQGEQIGFFTNVYDHCYQTKLQLIEITTHIIKYISESSMSQQLTSIGVISNWLQIILTLQEKTVSAKVICFRFVGQVMLYLPESIEQNEESLAYLGNNWNNLNLPQFTSLFNELIVILQRLGEQKNVLARKVYDLVSRIAKIVGEGDKRDYLIQNFLPLIAKFPTIPSQNLIQHLKHHPLSASQFLLICQSIQINQNTDTLIAVGKYLKNLFIQNPLLNFSLITLLKQIIGKIIQDEEEGFPFLQKTLQDVLQTFSVLQIKFKPKPKQQQSLYFGKNGSPQKISKSQQEGYIIKQKQKQIVLNFIVMVIDFAFSKQNENVQSIIKQKLLDSNSYIKKNNHKIGSKSLQDLLIKRFGVSKEQQLQHSEEFTKKSQVDLQQSYIAKKSKISHVSISTKLKGPENLTKEFQMIIQKRRQEQEDRKAQQLKKQILEEKKRLLAKKQIEISNLLRGHIGQAQLREEGFLSKISHENKQTEIILFDDLQSRQIDAVESIMKKYHRVLRHLFLNYTATMYSSHTNEKFQDNQQRKQILTAVELGKLLKDYKLIFLTNQGEISNLVRDINVRILNKRQVHQIDFIGFEQFIIQFCGLIMMRNFSITSTGSDGSTILNKSLKNEPLHSIIKEFFIYLKSVFLAKGEKINIFDDISDIPLNKEQAYQIDILNKKLAENPAYILPKGYKKISQNFIDFQYKIGNSFTGLGESYIAAIEALNYIFMKAPFSVNIIENISQKKTVYKIKPNSLNNLSNQIPRSRAMSTLIDRKSPLSSNHIKRGSSKQILNVLRKMPKSEKHIGEEAAGALQTIIDKISHKEYVKDKQALHHKKQATTSKMQQIQKNKFQAYQRKLKQKKEEKEAQQRRLKQQQQKRRDQNQKFLEQQRLKLTDKRKKDEYARMQKLKEQQQKQRVKKENQSKFKQFHQSQVQKIKKIGEQSMIKMKKSKQEQEEKKELHQQLKKRLRQKIQQDDKKIIESRRQMENKVQLMFENQTTKRIFNKYDINLRALYDFLIQQTHLSLTEKKHNNQIIFQTWRYFLNAFQMSFLIQSKDINYIFKNITKNKLVPKEYYVGLNFSEFQQALFKISIKYKTFFNLIAEKIKDNIIMQKIEQQKPKENGKGGKKAKNTKNEAKKQASKSKQQNEFEQNSNMNIKEILKQNTNVKDSQYYGDLSKVNEKTLIGLIYYLKVPNNKVGQQSRFRQILTNKSLHHIHGQERLKQRLNEEYTLQPSSKQNKGKQPSKQLQQQKSIVNPSKKSNKTLNNS